MSEHSSFVPSNTWTLKCLSSIAFSEITLTMPFSRDTKMVSSLISRTRKTDEVHDRVVVSSAAPSRHVAVVTRGGDPVEEAQVERTGAGLLLLHDDLRREELGAAPTLLLDQPVDVVAALLPRAQALDVMGEARELDYAGVADRDVAGHRHRWRR